MKGRPKKNVIPSDEYETVKVLYLEREASLREIARFFDVTQYEVTNVLLTLEVPLRRRGRKVGFKPPKKAPVVEDKGFDVTSTYVVPPNNGENE
jgi:hypothetical protein